MKTAVRRVRRAAAALWRFARLPRWLAAVFAACLVIPGPLDEMALVLAIGGVIGWQLRTRANRTRFRRYMHVAWSA
jgi:hypothetical protein